MRQWYAKLTSILVVFVASVTILQAQEPQLSAEANPSDPTGFAVVKFKLSKGDDVVWDVSPKPTLKKMYVEGDYTYLIFNGPSDKTYTVTADWINWDAKKRGRPTLDVVIGKAPQPPPGPNPPTPPDPPTPAPKGFRVIFVYETSQPVTPAMQQVMFGEKIRTYLDTKTVKGAAGNGYRRFDPDTKVDNEKDTEIKALWNAAKPHITTVPCVIVATDGKVEIINFPSGEDEALNTFKKYGG